MSSPHGCPYAVEVARTSRLTAAGRKAYENETAALATRVLALPEPFLGAYPEIRDLARLALRLADSASTLECTNKGACPIHGER